MVAPTFPHLLPIRLVAHAPALTGVHLYSSAGDVLYATPDLLSVHTVSGGPRTFALPRPAELVYDLFAGRAVATHTSAFEADLPPASTALYYTGPARAMPPQTSR